jgi:hypothetical protein
VVQDPQHGGLAAAAGADEAYELAPADLQADVVQSQRAGLLSLERLGDVPRVDDDSVITVYGHARPIALVS